MASGPFLFAIPGGFIDVVPSNPDSRESFDAVARHVKQVDNIDATIDVRHAERFMCIEPVTSEQAVEEEAPQLHENGDENRTIIESSPLPEEPRLQYQGHYRLSFDRIPDIPENGWALGTGRWKDDNTGLTADGVVDLLLASNSDGKDKYLVNGYHATIEFDEYGSLRLRSTGPTIVLDGEAFSKGTRLLARRSATVLLGKLAYTISFRDINQHIYQDNLQLYRQMYQNLGPQDRDIAAMPSDWDSIIGDWICLGTAGAGGFGVVVAAKHRLTGKPAAAKVVVENYTLDDVHRELYNLTRLPIHSRLLVSCGIWQESFSRLKGGNREDHRTDERFNMPRRAQRVVFIVQPYAKLNLADVLRLGLSRELRLKGLYQILEGLQALHNRVPFPIIHRDIKPHNIGVVKFDKDLGIIEIVILDFGLSVEDQLESVGDMQWGMLGTQGYMAPELAYAPHSPAMDIWSCGIIAQQMFPVVQALGPGLLSHANNPTMPEHLTAQMLQLNPLVRVTANEALLHDCFKVYSAVIQPAAEEVPLGGEGLAEGGLLLGEEEPAEAGFLGEEKLSDDEVSEKDGEYESDEVPPEEKGPVGDEEYSEEEESSGDEEDSEEEELAGDEVHPGDEESSEEDDVPANKRIRQT